MTSRRSFGERLVAAVEAYGPLCVGIDPHPGLLAAWGLADDAAGLERFAMTALEALGGHVAVVKPQSAFFERHGAAGVAVLERLLAATAQTGTLSLLDVKRGDIGSTMDGYADAYLRVGAPLAADAVTLSPYLGLGSLAPALRVAGEAGRGVFVLARTSNPEGAEVQLADRAGRSVAQAIVDGVAALNAGVTPLGHVGVVVGATDAHGLALGELNGAVLAPGIGAQGAGPGDVAARFAGAGGLVLPSASRSVLGAGPDPGAVRAAALALGNEIARENSTAGRSGGGRP
ncbi:orotidine-5'-phosphate decarboxylase [Pseudonocardia hispaniensis]|uniref:Orotidine 5'-phosphate decarboxylase n=1 Tax=Pseudonocardia hispaniensis TaxID=904933 RepID=A0ABW1J0I2_9PSEU